MKHSPIPAALLGLSFGAMLSASFTMALLRYQRNAILDGDWWRLLTAHFVHGSWGHWAFNAGGLVLIWAIYPQRFAQRCALPLIVLIALSTSLALLILAPTVGWYLGMSALLHGLFVAWSIESLLGRQRWAWLGLAAVSAKLAYEQLIGPLPGSVEAAGLPVLVDAHLYAALAGGVLGVTKALAEKCLGEGRKRCSP